MAWSQKSYQQNEEKGCIYLVPTPIGNLEDMTYRAVNVLKNVDYIAAEDTRHTKKLLHAFNIENRLVSYHEHNKKTSGQRRGESLTIQEFAQISDQLYSIVHKTE